jgi:hypothetical protein
VATTVELCFDDAGELARHWREHLSRGAAWLAGHTLEHDLVLDLVIRAPSGAHLIIGARVVMAAAHGSGLELTGFGPSLRAELEAMVSAAADEPEPEPEPDDGAPPRDPIARNVHERLRGLTPVEQQKVAATGETHERIVLERIYGKAVWEPLLHNPRLTFPEVARIARMGALSRPLLELIVGNGAWLKSPEVRRALLANPRLATDQTLRILRLLPKRELKLVPMQTAYPAAVRDAARRVLSGAE